jgi:hypothetical protein
VLGFDHADTGNALVGQWHLPTDLSAVVAHHHVPSRVSPLDPLTAAVHVACLVCSAAGLGAEGIDLVPPVDAAAWEAVGLSGRKLCTFLDGAEEEIALFLEMIDS